MVYGGQKMKIKTIPIMMIVAVGVCSAFWIINSVNKIIEKEDNSLSAECLMDIVPAAETTPLETEPEIAEAEVTVSITMIKYQEGLFTNQQEASIMMK